MTEKRTGLLTQLDEALRKVGAQSVIMTDTVGRLVGLNATDLKCLDLLYLAGPTTPGKLAKHTGLTTGAMTAVIDRLESAGFVRRLRDAEDRRRVRVEAQPRSIRRIEPLYSRLAASTAELHDRYDDRQLALVVDYLTRALDLVTEHVTWLQTQPPVRRVSTTRPRRTGRREPASVSAALHG